MITTTPVETYLTACQHVLIDSRPMTVRSLRSAWGADRLALGPAGGPASEGASDDVDRSVVCCAS